jgi:hypothetical protein
MARAGAVVQAFQSVSTAQWYSVSEHLKVVQLSFFSGLKLAVPFGNLPEFLVFVFVCSD